MKKILSLFIAAVFAISASVSAAADSVNVKGDGNTIIFSDVPSDYWARSQIEYYAKQGIVDGYEDGSFRPDNGVTREEFCKVLVLAFDQTPPKPDEQTFADVDKGRWSWPYVEYCSDFLTGYTNPFGGAPSFHPSEDAMREDIAVALVRMLGFTADSADDADYNLRKFTDKNEISPSLRGFVSVASRQGLVNGYPDGSFAPQRGITRAEMLTLMNRATKQAVADIKADLELETSVSYNGSTARVNIVTERGAAVTVNGKNVKMYDSYDNYGDVAEGVYLYEFEEEGNEQLYVEAKKAGKIASKYLSLEYELSKPVIKIRNCPTTTSESYVTVSGTVSDEKTSASNIEVTVNGYSASVNYYGEWSCKIPLKPGKNKVKITAANTMGKSETIERTIEYDYDDPSSSPSRRSSSSSSRSAPKIKITDCPSYTDDEKITISGTVNDSHTSAKDIDVEVNGHDVDVSASGSWSADVKLDEGSNVIRITAENSYGMISAENITVVRNRKDDSTPEPKATEEPAAVKEPEATAEPTEAPTAEPSPEIELNVTVNRSAEIIRVPDSNDRIFESESKAVEKPAATPAPKLKEEPKPTPTPIPSEKNEKKADLYDANMIVQMEDSKEETQGLAVLFGF